MKIDIFALKILLKFVLGGPIGNKSELVHVMIG